MSTQPSLFGAPPRDAVVREAKEAIVAAVAHLAGVDVPAPDGRAVNALFEARIALDKAGKLLVSVGGGDGLAGLVAAALKATIAAEEALSQMLASQVWAGSGWKRAHAQALRAAQSALRAIPKVNPRKKRSSAFPPDAGAQARAIWLDANDPSPQGPNFDVTWDERNRHVWIAGDVGGGARKAELVGFDEGRAYRVGPGGRRLEMARKGNPTTIKARNGKLFAVYEDKLFSEPTRVRSWYPINAAERDYPEIVGADVPTFLDDRGGRVRVRSTGRTLEFWMPQGGDTLPEFTEKEPIAPPPARGKELRYHQGQWERLTARGWAPAGEGKARKGNPSPRGRTACAGDGPHSPTRRLPVYVGAAGKVSGPRCMACAERLLGVPVEVMDRGHELIYRPAREENPKRKRKTTTTTTTKSVRVVKVNAAEVQAVAFEKKRWNVAQARAWLKRHGFKDGKRDATANYLRFRQLPPGRFKSYRAKALSGGVALVLGVS